MKSKKPLYVYIFDLLDFADEIADRITPEDKDHYNNMYFMTLIYVEDIMDKYGRMVVSQAINEAARSKPKLHLRKSSHPSKADFAEAGRRLDKLRDRLRHLVDTYDFDEVLQYKGPRFYQEWHKSAFHPSNSPSQK